MYENFRQIDFFAVRTYVSKSVMIKGGKLKRKSFHFFRALVMIGRDDNTKNVPSKRKEQEAILRLTGKTTVN